MTDANYRTAIVVAIIGLVGTIAAAVISNWDTIVRSRAASVPTHVTDTSTPIPSRVKVRLYRTPSDPREVFDITGGSISVARKMAEVEFTKTGINYSFQIQCYDQADHLVGVSGQNDDSKWPDGCVIPK